MELGVFSLSDIYPGSPDTAASRTTDIIDYGVLAEQHGLDVFGIGEHHSRAFAVSSPAVVHAAIARATNRITREPQPRPVLPVLDPVRVYQDFATLDLISRGRARSVPGERFHRAIALFGENMADYDELFAEKLYSSSACATTTQSPGPARWLPLQDEKPNPQPTGKLPAGSLSAALRRRPPGRDDWPTDGLGLIGGTYRPRQTVVDVYRTAGRDAGHPVDQLTVGITSHFYVGATPRGGALGLRSLLSPIPPPDTNNGRGWHITHARR